MKRVAALLLLSLAAAGAQAHPHGKHLNNHMQCEVRSDYTMKMRGKAFVFTSDREAARHVALGGGRLFVNGDEVKLTAADRVRVREYEAELNRMLPRLNHVVTEATDIAFTALIEVARGFATDGGKASVARLERAHREVRADLASRPIMLFNDDDIGERIIEPVLAEYVPVIAGAAVTSTLAVAFSGDERKARRFERNMERMGKDIEDKVERRAEALEPLVESLCKSTRELDRIEDGLALRLEDGEPLDLLRASR
jgi:hypothetical protein